jgi:predicted RNase H-like HicB family nuclease
MMTPVKTYAVQAVRSEGWWGLTVPAVPGAVSQVRSLASAEEYVREAIAFVAGVAPDSFAVDVIPQLPAHLAEEVARARSATAVAERAQAEASGLTRNVVTQLAAAGYNGRETAVILGVSKQRVSQLASEPRRRAKNAAGGGRPIASGGRTPRAITPAGPPPEPSRPAADPAPPAAPPGPRRSAAPT